MAKSLEYQKTLKKLKLDEATLSAGIKGQIVNITNAQQHLVDAESKNETERVAEISSDIAVMDTALVKAIERYPAQLENMRKMAQARKDKKNAPAPVAPETTPTPVESPTVAATGEQTPAPVVAAAGGEVPATPEEEKKGGGGIGWFFGVVAVAILAAVGIKYAKDRG